MLYVFKYVLKALQVTARGCVKALGMREHARINRHIASERTLTHVSIRHYGAYCQCLASANVTLKKKN